MTHASVARDELLTHVRQLIECKFPDGVISDGWISEDVDELGERVLLITAVFEGTTEAFVTKKPGGLMRYLRNRLLASNEKAFPLLSFVSAAEAHV